MGLEMISNASYFYPRYIRQVGERINMKRLLVSQKPQRVWTVWISTVPVIWLQFLTPPSAPSRDRTTARSSVSSSRPLDSIPNGKHRVLKEVNESVTLFIKLVFKIQSLCRGLYHKASPALGACFTEPSCERREVPNYKKQRQNSEWGTLYDTRLRGRKSHN